VEGIRLDQDPVKIQAVRRLLENGLLTEFVGVLGLLGQSHAKSTDINRDLGDNAVDAVICSIADPAAVTPVWDSLVESHHVIRCGLYRLQQRGFRASGAVKPGDQAQQIR
jgi:hypothetical protein